MQQPFPAGVALAGATMIAVASLAPLPDILPSARGAVDAVADLAASDAYLDLLQAPFDLFTSGQPGDLTTGLSAALPLSDSAISDLIPSWLLNTLLVAGESTVLAFWNIVTAVGTLNLFEVVGAILDFPFIIVIPTVVTLVDHLLLGGDSSGESVASAATLLGGGSDVLAQLGAELADGLNPAIGSLFNDLGLDALLP